MIQKSELDNNRSRQDGPLRMSLQEDLIKNSEWSERWEMPSNVNKCHILQIMQLEKKIDYEMSGVNLEGV